MIKITESTAARKIQKSFRHYYGTQKSSKYTPEMKKTVMSEMEYINRIITISPTAHYVNLDQMQICDDELQPKRKRSENKTASMILPEIDNDLLFFDSLLHIHEISTTSLILKVMQKQFEKKIMICDHLAIYLGVLLFHNPNLSSEIKSQIHICKVDGHVFVVIGDPLDESSLAIDPWIRYLNFSANQAEYRSEPSLFETRRRGFFGQIWQYKNFLKAHPNRYVLEGTTCEMHTISHYTKAIADITPEMIHNPICSSESATLTFLDEYIFSVKDEKILGAIFRSALDCKYHNAIEILLKHPKISDARHSKTGNSVFHLAVLYHRSDILKLLLNLNPEGVFQTNALGDTALDMADCMRRDDMVLILKAIKEQYQFLL